jgi:hypothetical protein
MEEDYSRTPRGQIQTLARKSWTAYIKLTLFTLLALLLVPSIWHSSWKWGAGLLSAVLLVAGYRFALLRSYHLYCDADGVWIYGGVLPWARGIAGVKWRDVDEALMIQTLWSWLFKSYTIRIGHRFTKANEIVLTHMARGNQAVSNLNDMHRQLIREGALT